MHLIEGLNELMQVKHRRGWCVYSKKHQKKKKKAVSFGEDLCEQGQVMAFWSRSISGEAFPTFTMWFWSE